MTEVLSFHNHEASPVNELDNEFAMHLKPVFDACDYSGDGYVKVQDLIELGKKHSVGNSGEVRKLIIANISMKYVLHFVLKLMIVGRQNVVMLSQKWVFCFI